MHTAGAGKLEFGAPPFVFSCGPVPLPETIAFTLQSPTTCVNVMKVCTREGHTLLSLFLILSVLPLNATWWAALVISSCYRFSEPCS